MCLLCVHSLVPGNTGNLTAACLLGPQQVRAVFTVRMRCGSFSQCNHMPTASLHRPRMHVSFSAYNNDGLKRLLSVCNLTQDSEQPLPSWLLLTVLVQVQPQANNFV